METLKEFVGVMVIVAGVAFAFIGLVVTCAPSPLEPYTCTSRDIPTGDCLVWERNP